MENRDFEDSTYYNEVMVRLETIGCTDIKEGFWGLCDNFTRNFLQNVYFINEDNIEETLLDYCSVYVSDDTFNITIKGGYAYSFRFLPDGQIHIMHGPY